MVRLHGHAAIVAPRRAAGILAHHARAGRIVAERRNRRRQRVRLAGRRDRAAVVLAGDDRRFAARVDGRDKRPARRQNAVHLARHDVAFDAPLERHEKRIGRRERFVQQRLGLVGKEPDVRQAAPGRHLLERLTPGAIADDRHDQPFPGLQPRRRLDEQVEVLREADVARMHQDEPIAQAVRARERVVLGSGRDGLAVRPVVNDVDAVGVGALLLDQPPLHAVAERDDGVGFAEQIPVDAVERAVDRLVVEVLEERRHFRKDVLAQEHEARARPARRPERRQAENRRIGQRHHDVLRAEPPARRERRREVAQVVAGAPGESPARERRAVGAENPHAPPFLGADGPQASPRTAASVQGAPGDHRHGAAVAGDQILGQLGQQLARGGLVGPVRAIEEAEFHVVRALRSA